MTILTSEIDYCAERLKTEMEYLRKLTALLNQQEEWVGKQAEEVKRCEPADWHHSDDVDYWARRLKMETYLLEGMTATLTTLAERVQRQTEEVEIWDRALVWRMRHRAKLLRPVRTSTRVPVRRSARIAARVAKARIAQDAGLRRSARIAARTQ